MSKPNVRFDYESLSRIRMPAGRPLRLLIAVAGLICVGALFMSPRAREYVPYGQHRVDEYISPEASPMPAHPNIPVNVTASAPAADPYTHRANATLLMLARNEELDYVDASMRALEQAFNYKRKYPWIFLNEVPFTLEFKQRVRTLTNAEVHFGLIPRDHWYPPASIDDERYDRDRKAMAAIPDIPYADSKSYRNMCRFNSGFFYRHELLDQYRWYWRVEPNVNFPCDIPYDPFAYMIQNNKRYSFTITLSEFMETIPTLWDHAKSFMSKNPEYIAKNNALPFITDDGGKTFNGCHIWSNFEIADLDFFRSDAYQAFFKSLDATGNFYYERWGDAPVHSIAAALFLPRDQLHYFRDIGYTHKPFSNCPDSPMNQQRRCGCNPPEGFQIVEPKGSLCLKRFEALFPDKLVG
ncbi:glycosyl transferase [Phellopilus nigrolimitatus]|nr:glycosyl transferase [Phellopilus nigrolimitatus]